MEWAAAELRERYGPLPPDAGPPPPQFIHPDFPSLGPAADWDAWREHCYRSRLRDDSDDFSDDEFPSEPAHD